MGNKYKILNQQKWADGEYTIVPIRFKDRYKIMQWRNEQIYHLRQSEPLTPEMQDAYFENVVSKLFDLEQPDQILFSLLKGDQSIGYGGLVHINWVDKNAEVSFVMNTSLEEKHFVELWVVFLQLIEKVAFNELKLHKIFTYAFDLRPKLYEALFLVSFKEEARLKKHVIIENTYYDVLIHSKHRSAHELTLRPAKKDDALMIFNWANDEDVRNNALNSNKIQWTDHLLWFDRVLHDPKKCIFIFYLAENPVGQIRIEKGSDEWRIDYSVNKNNRGKGIGKKMIDKLLATFPDRTFFGEVKSTNIPSQKVFTKCGFITTGKKHFDEYQLFTYKKHGERI